MITIRRIVGVSMQPTYSPGTIVFGLRWLRPKVGSVVLIRHDGLDIIKRIAALKDDAIYIVGDNRAQSTDSRRYGWLPQASIKSVIIGSIAR